MRQTTIVHRVGALAAALFLSVGAQGFQPESPVGVDAWS